MSFKPKENHGCYSMIRVAVVAFFFYENLRVPHLGQTGY